MVWVTAVMLSCLTNMLNIKETSFPYRASSLSSFSSFIFFSSFSFFFVFFNGAVAYKGPRPPRQFTSRYPYHLLLSSILLYSAATRRPLMSFRLSCLPAGFIPWNIPSSTFLDTLELSVQTIRPRPFNLLNLIRFTTLGSFNIS